MPGMIITTDFSDESRRAFEPARALAKRLGLPVTLLTVIEETPMEMLATGAPVAWPDRQQIRRDVTERMQKLVQEVGGDGVAFAVVDGLDAAVAITEHADKVQADFVAMATHGRTGLRRLLMGSVAESVVRRAKVPVILYPPARS